MGVKGHLAIENKYNVLVAIDCIIEYVDTRITGSLSESSRTNTGEDQHNQSPVSDILFLSEITMFAQAVIQVEIKSAGLVRSRWWGVLMNISNISVCPAVWCRCLLSSDKRHPARRPAQIVKKENLHPFLLPISVN